LKLTGLEYLEKINGLSFDDLERTLQRSIIMRPITVNLLKKSPRNVRCILFRRLNTGGLVLNPYEIRNAIYQGKATETIKELSETPEFLNATDKKIPTNRMQDKDFVCRFVAFYLTDHTKYVPDLDSFLNTGMELLEKKDMESIKQDFIKALRLAMDIFGNDAFRKRTNKTASRQPINKAYFEVITTGFSKLDDKDEKKLRQNSELFKNNLITLMNYQRYSDSLSSGTGKKESVNTRFFLFQDVINESIKGNIYKIELKENVQ
jgi:hypothetical protein